MTNFTTIQAEVNLADAPARTPGEVNEALTRLGIERPLQYTEAMQPEEIDAQSGIWNIWVPAVIVNHLLRDGQFHRAALNAEITAEMP